MYKGMGGLFPNIFDSNITSSNNGPLGYISTLSSPCHTNRGQDLQDNCILEWTMILMDECKRRRQLIALELWKFSRADRNKGMRISDLLVFNLQGRTIHRIIIMW